MADFPYPKRGALAVPDESAMDYADLHHLTALPESIKKFKLKTFSLLGLEQALQQRINQHTSRDSDRFRQILRLFKEQTRRGDTDEDTPLMGVNRAQFATILALLGLFATVDQTNALFAKYDTNGDGALTVHEFLTRCRPADYVGARWHDMKEGGDGYVRGKKMYGAGATGGGVGDDGTDTRPHASSSTLSRGNLKVSATSEYGTGRVRAQTPTDALCHLTIERIAAKLRDKLRCRGAVGSTLSFPRTRRHFAKTFEYYDKDGRGTVDEEGLRHALDDINFPLGSAHRSLIMQNFAVGDRLDYVAFIRFVFPQDNCSTSLRLGELEPPEPAALSMESGSFAPSLSGTPFGRSAAFTTATAAPYADSKEQAPPASSSGSMSARGFGSTHPSSFTTRAFVPRPPGAAPVDASQWNPAAGRPNAPYDGGVAATMTSRRPMSHASGSQSARGAAPRGLYSGSSGAAAAGLPPVVSVGGRTFVRTADAPPSAFPSSSFASYPSASSSSSHVPAFARPPLPAPPASVYGGSGSIRFG